MLHTRFSWFDMTRTLPFVRRGDVRASNVCSTIHHDARPVCKFWQMYLNEAHKVSDVYEIRPCRSPYNPPRTIRAARMGTPGFAVTLRHKKKVKRLWQIRHARIPSIIKNNVMVYDWARRQSRPKP
jgi:hypothetical protein